MTKTKLYKICKDAICIKCESKGAVQSFGEWCPNGLGEDVGTSIVLEKYRDTPFMNQSFGFGGTIPYECLNCGNTGLIDMDGLEGYNKAFEIE